MATNTLLTISMVTREALRLLENNLVILKYCNRQLEDKFAVEGAKIGQVINVRKPPKYLGRQGQQMVVENSVETSVPFVLDTQFGVDLEFSAADLALSIDDFADRFLKSAVSTIAQRIDSDAARLYKKFYNIVGTPGTTPSTLLTYLLAGVDLDDESAPIDDQRYIFMTSFMQATIVDALKGLFQQANAIGQQYMRGKMGTAAGFEWFMDQSIATHTVGTYGGTPLVNGANQTGTSLITDGWSSGASTLNEGDVFTIAGVRHVNPQTRESTGRLQKFVVTSQISDTTGNMTIPIYPPIVVGTAYATVDALPADNAAITVIGATGAISPQGLALHKDAITFASADLPVPRSTDMAGRISDPQLGISIRMIRDYTILTDQFPMRLDVLYGIDVLRPELGVRIAA